MEGPTWLDLQRSPNERKTRLLHTPISIFSHMSVCNKHSLPEVWRHSIVALRAKTSPIIFSLRWEFPSVVIAVSL